MADSDAPACLPGGAGCHTERMGIDDQLVSESPARNPAGWTVEIGDRKYDRADMDRLVEKNTARGLEAGEQMMVLRELFARYHMNVRQQT